MQAIYTPKGRALEYAPLALNLYRGCNHRCSYCFAPNVLRMTSDNFSKPQPRIEIINTLKKSAHKYKGQEVLLSFSTDPYNSLDNTIHLTRDAIKILHENEIKVRILTKAGRASERDFDLLAVRSDLSCYGATLTFTNEQDSLRYEPYAALPVERFWALCEAHKLGIPTWASLEPVIDPMQTLDIIRLTNIFVDEYKVGKLNYDKGAAKIDWKSFGNEVERVLLNFGKKYLIKKDLRAEMAK